MFWSLLLLAGTVLATSDIHVVQVYHPSQFENNALCLAKSCPEQSVCFVASETAICVKKNVAREKLGKHRFVEHGKPEELIRKPHEHHTLDAEVKQEKHANHKCSREELDSMGGRLVQWFENMHQINGGIDVSLKSHKFVCHADVAWMFEQWDGDQDGQLSKKELAPLIGGMREKCLEHFLDMCDDISTDGSISIDEWCDCFTFSHDTRHEPPCHKEKHHADPHLLGVFIPRCDLEGFYQPEQCHSGHCWCVDKYGREFDNSRLKGTLPDCGQYGHELTEEEEEDLHARI